MKKVLIESEKHNLKLEKPAKMGIGKTMTIAQRKNYIQTDGDGIVDIKLTIEELREY